MLNEQTAASVLMRREDAAVCSLLPFQHRPLLLNRSLVILLRHMTVDIQHSAGLCVLQRTCRGLHIHVLANEQAGVGVPQAVHGK